MKTTFKIFLVFVLMFGLAMAAGTASAKKKKKPVYSGFLGDYPKFERGAKGGVDWVYLKKGVDFKVYDKVMIDQVVFYFKPDAKYKGIHPDEIKQLSDAFHQSMVDALGKKYPLVDKAGPGVLRIRFAITDVVPSKPGLNTVTSIVPVGLAISLIKKGITGSHTFVGQASVEVEFLDSQTNERLAAAIDTKTGKKYKIIKGAKKWGHAKDAFKFWSKRLRKWLDDVHEK